jgi:diamine N-acetyltransferase
MDSGIKRLRLNELGRIKELWEKLNVHHQEKSPDFKEHYSRQTFESRFENILNMSEDRVRVDIVYECSKPAGYCVCIIENGGGELASIYIEPAFRNKGAGIILAGNGIAWIKEKGCDPITVTVAGGNEAAFPFYGKLGFGVRRTVMQIK